MNVKSSSHLVLLYQIVSKSFMIDSLKEKQTGLSHKRIKQELQKQIQEKYQGRRVQEVKKKTYNYPIYSQTDLDTQFLQDFQTYMNTKTNSLTKSYSRN